MVKRKHWAHNYSTTEDTSATDVGLFIISELENRSQLLHRQKLAKQQVPI